MKTQSENKTMQQWYFCGISLKEHEGKSKEQHEHTHTPHTDTSFTPQRIVVHRVLEKGYERTAFIQRFVDNSN